eukprot:SAG22_NODE_2810_length_2190_cov_1.417025_2_plen_77_part_00
MCKTLTEMATAGRAWCLEVPPLAETGFKLIKLPDELAQALKAYTEKELAKAGGDVLCVHTSHITTSMPAATDRPTV